MLLTRTEQVRKTLERLQAELHHAIDSVGHYHDRLRAFRHYCNSTPPLAQSLAQLPQVSYDQNEIIRGNWPGGERSLAIRWKLICDIADANMDGVKKILDRFFFSLDSPEALGRFTKQYVVPVCNYLVGQLEAASTVLYLLIRYKRWAEWFEADRLRQKYEQASAHHGEDVLDRDLRRFLFESGIDYPFSQPHSPGGKADVVARLETDDPLVLEIKVWDSNRGYTDNRLRDGLRQVMDYTAKYGKNIGYVAVFNLDPEPLVFAGSCQTDQESARLEIGGRTYYFVAVDIARQSDPVSHRDRGQPVKVNEISLADLLNSS